MSAWPREDRRGVDVGPTSSEHVPVAERVDGLGELARGRPS